jgi:hypothetical protein
MAIARGSVLAGHVDGGTILITVAIAALLGFARRHAAPSTTRTAGVG